MERYIHARILVKPVYTPDHKFASLILNITLINNRLLIIDDILLGTISIVHEEFRSNILRSLTFAFLRFKFLHFTNEGIKE